jgi:putative heme iron utilization protein
MTPEGTEARRYLRGRRYGALATNSKKLSGYPFGSLVPFVLDHAAQPVIFISRLAEHTRNIDADPHVSLLVHDAATDVQAAARLTLAGDAVRVNDGLESLRQRYLNYFPNAEQLFALGDFSFYRVAPVMLRFIGGFGAIHWISAESYAPPVNRFDVDEQAIIAYMNTDHRQDLRDCCRHHHQLDVEEIAMAGIDCDGFDVSADCGLLRFDFEQPVVNAAEARQALVAMAQQARP